ncbi:MAG TPA: PilZ domain-containing protein [Solirubrobacteraceae bacterium]
MLRERSTQQCRQATAGLTLPCTLCRAAGSPIASKVLDLKISGMRVDSQRPLSIDEWLAFSVEHDGDCIRGRVRVVCQERPTIYGLRFERLPEPEARMLQSLVSALA